MTQTKSWELDKNTLDSALARFHATDPDIFTRERVNEWLQETLLPEPLLAGQEDPNSPGIFFGRVNKTDVGVLYVPNTDEMVIYVSDIASS